ncbi:MAG TPA: PAS domain S-box protein, partial [bacterium]|nr:PAS domain S-box protein [bacterium]
MAENAHDVCLLDYRLEGRNGLDFLKEAGEKGFTTPIILLTGLADYEVDLEAMRLGASDFLHKNKIDKATLERAIRYALERKKSAETLRHREEFYRALIENALDGVAVLGPDGTIRFASPSVERILGYSLNEKIGTSVFELIHPGDLIRVRELFNRLLLSPGLILSDEFQARHKDASWRTVEATGKSGIFGIPPVEAVVINFRDVTGRKAADRATARLASIVESSNDAVYSLSLDGVILSWNPGAVRIYGFKAEEAGGRDVSLVAPLGRRDEFPRLLATVAEGKAVANFTTAHQAKDGREILLSLTLSPLRDASGRVQMASVIARDVTESERAKSLKEALQAERDELLDRLQLQMEVMPISCILLDQHFNLLYWNPAAEKMFGYRFDEVEGKSILFLATEGEREGLEESFRRIQKGESMPPTSVREARRKDGRVLTCEWHGALLKDGEGNPAGAMVMALDITDRKKAEENRTRLAYILEQTPDAVVIADWNDKIIEWNKGAERTFGYSAKEAVGKHLSILIPDDQLAEFAQRSKDFHEGGEIDFFETTRKKKNGQLIQVSVSAGPLKEPSGRIVGFSAIYRDITEMKKAQENQRLLASILAQTHDGVVVSDLKGIILEWNQGAEEIYGYKAGEIVGRSSRILEPPGHQGEIDSFRGQLLAGAEAVRYETVRLRKDGKSIHIDATLSPLKNEKGEITAFSAIVRDITTRKKAEDVQNQLAAILQQTPDAVIGGDLEGNIFSWNRGAEVMFGYSFDEIIGKPVTLLAPPDRVKELTEIREIAQKGEVISNFETVRLRKDGQLVDVSATLFPTKDSNGKTLGVSAILRDITERKKAEDSLRQHEEQLHRVEKMNAIGRLAGGVAHDFNNLLSVIGGNAEFLLSGLKEDDPHREEVEEIQKAVRRGADLTKQLLVFGQKQVVQPQPVNLNDLTAEMSKMVKRLIDANVDLAIIQDKALKPMLADPGQMQQVILNLVLNARDAMPQGGHLMIETKHVEAEQLGREKRPTLPPGSYSRISVTDTGTGMSEEIQKHIFEPFFTTKAGKGTGLGLASVYAIVRKWSGHIFLYSSPGMGSTFSIYFPTLSQEEGPKEKPKQMTLIPQGSETILLAEDEDPVRKILVRGLEKFGYKVWEARNGIEAVQMAWARKEDIHLLLTDTVMPKMNGKELADEIRKSRPKTKVLFISGYPREVLSQQGIMAPDIHLLQKPFEIEDLAREIRKVLDAKK